MKQDKKLTEKQKKTAKIILFIADMILMVCIGGLIMQSIYESEGNATRFFWACFLQLGLSIYFGVKGTSFNSVFIKNSVYLVMLMIPALIIFESFFGGAIMAFIISLASLAASEIVYGIKRLIKK